ncbi:MAG: DUF1553 domain-containing protein, partial [Planctomycetales bacterium]|nr:DUF1553 domain-containing protein [Planctomycetales bacterium]
ANLSGDQVGEDESPRVALVKWLTDPANPLTARVEVNRIWQHHFGTGLSSTPNDFGVMSDDPTHPELLDYLADELMQGGWSTKRLHRMIVMSNVYRTAGTRPTDEQRRSEWDQAVSIDPDNRLLSHFPRRRLSAEAIRDGLLAVSDSLNYKTGGPGVMPPLPAEMVKTLLSGQWKVTPSQTEHDRRSVYLFARRNLRFPFFATFDRPSADQPCARRDQSTTAIQSLMLLNSELMMQASERLARAVSRDNADVETQIRSLYQRLYSRFPNPNELASAKGFLATDASLKDLCRAMLNSNEFLYVD